MLELLAPCGDLKTYYIAVNSGADAVYLGMSNFSARKNAVNFSEDELRKAVRHAHILGVKVYVAVNTLVKQKELPTFFETLKTAYEIGVDAFILQDVFLGKRIRAEFPDIALHLSTQAGVCDENGALLAKEYGFDRVILARETPLSEIKRISAHIETECFVQGALCTCFSGHCYLSSFAGGNSGNRGRCKQPCRQKYAFCIDGVKGEENYAISPSDLCVAEDISKYMEAGVTSFKIEGRMRRGEYVASAVRYYRALLDGKSPSKMQISDLKRTFNRGEYTKGLAFGQDERFLSQNVQGHIGEKVGVVQSFDGKLVFIRSMHRLSSGDAFKVIRKGKEVGSCFATDFSMRKKATDGFYVETDAKLVAGDEVRITTDAKLNQKLLDQSARLQPVEVEVVVSADQKATATVSCKDKRVVVESDEVFPVATGAGITEEDVKKCFLKTDELPIAPTIKICSRGRVFAPKSMLNAFRRKAYQSFACLFETSRKNCDKNDDFEQNISTMRDIITHKNISIYNDISKIKENSEDVVVFAPNDYKNCADFDVFLQKTASANEKYLYVPAFFVREDYDIILPQITRFDGIYADGVGALYFAKQHNLQVIGGLGLNLFHSYDVIEMEKISKYFCFSKELSAKEIDDVISAYPPAKNGFVFTSGTIKVMDFAYCLMGKNCKSCRLNSASLLSFIDYAGRVFPVRRVEASSCRFEMHNESILQSNLHFNHTLKSMISAGIVDEYSVTKRTGGHLKNSVE